MADANCLLPECIQAEEAIQWLLADIESQTGFEVRDFKERLKAIIKEQDDAEDKGSLLITNEQECKGIGSRCLQKIEEIK